MIGDSAHGYPLWVSLGANRLVYTADDKGIQFEDESHARAFLLTLQHAIEKRRERVRA